MTMTSLKRKVEDGNDEPNSKQTKLLNSRKQKEETGTAIVEIFHDLVIFIFPAGIQKARLQLFKSQVKKYGGCLKDSLTNDVTHIIVDEAMTIERMCRILKRDTPPADKTIVKTTWLSACLRQKAIVSTTDFLLAVPCSVPTKSKDVENPQKSNTETEKEKTETNKEPVPTKSKDVENPRKSNTETEKEKTETNKEPEPSGSELKFPRVGVMWNAFRSKPKGEESEDADSDYVPSEDEGFDSGHAAVKDAESTSSTDTTPNTSPEKIIPVGKWICTQSSKAPKANLNEHITAKLEEMVKNYESTNDKWRAFGYQKAVAALKRFPKEISSWEEAQSLQGVGAKLADKIWEIAQSGELRKLNEFQSNEQVRVLKLFTDVWGAGPTTASAWYQQGFRTIEDLRSKANLTHQQKVGVRLYEDLLDRMPREEAAEIEAVVKEAAESIQPGIIAQACGSYRRGKKDCGDVDILLTHPDGHSEKGVFGKLIQHLKRTGFLTDDLVSVEDNGNQKKYLGVCKLPGPNRKHRRLDIIVVPYEEYACALVYFTGSAHFNRSLRHLCKKMNMSLNEHALRKGVVRKGQEKVFEGIIVPTPTEESVLAALGVPFRPPEERDH